MAVTGALKPLPILYNRYQSVSGDRKVCLAVLHSNRHDSIVGKITRYPLKAAKCIAGDSIPNGAGGSLRPWTISEAVVPLLCVLLWDVVIPASGLVTGNVVSELAFPPTSSNLSKVEIAGREVSPCRFVGMGRVPHQFLGTGLCRVSCSSRFRESPP